MKLIIIFWLAVIVSVCALSIYSYLKVQNKLTAILCLFLGLLFPAVFVFIDCMVSLISEQCVWGKSFLVLTVPLSLFALSPALYLLVSFCQVLYGRLYKINN